MRSRRGPALLLAALLTVETHAQNPTWNWSNPQPHGNDVVTMVWNGSLGVQVCEKGRVYTSANLVDWFYQNCGLTNDLEAVAFFGNRLIVAGAEGAIAYSDDGVNFTRCSVNTTNWLVSVASSPTTAVTVGDNGVLYTSANGAIWQLQSPPPLLAPSWLTSVAFGNGVFVTVGDDGNVPGGSYIANSSDGIHWTNQTPSYAFMSGLGNLESVTYVNSSGSPANFPFTGFWAVDDIGNAIYSTNNGAAWKRLFIGASTNVLYTIAADRTTALLAGNNEVRLGTVVSNLLAWSPQTVQGPSGAPPWTYFTALSETNGTYDLAGADGMLVQSYVTNGTYNWRMPYFSARDWLWQVTVTNGLYIAVGDNVRVMTSANGADWSIEAVPLTNSISTTNTVFFCVGGTTNLLVAAGTKGSLAVSVNTLVPEVETNSDGSLFTNNASSLGVLWSSLPSPAGTTNDLAGVAYFTNHYYLVGGNGTILNSPDGTNWARLASGTSYYLSGISASTNNLLVLTGNEGTILTSPNGTNWTARASSTTNWLYRVRCVDGQLITVGENGTLLTSDDGINWTKQTTGVTNWLNDAIMISNTCYVVGNQGVVLASTNLTQWTNQGTITAKSLESVASQNGQLVAVGFEGTILRSQVIPESTPVDFTQYSQSGGFNVFTVAGSVDQQFTLDSSTNFANWITGPLLNLIYGDGTLVFFQAVPANSPGQYYRCTVVP